MNRKDFNMLNSSLVYLDSSATTLKPSVLSDATIDYYNNYSANAHRGDYDISLRVDEEYENTRLLVKNLINADSVNEIVFTSGTTDSLNKIIFGYFKHNLIESDEVILSKSEHASNILPWFELKDTNKINIKYVELDANYQVTLDNIIAQITPKTRVISLAHVTNVIGDIRPIKEICEYAHKNNILVIVDGAQSVPHFNVDVQYLDIDFLAFSAHKMCGPTGVGILYGKKQLLEKMLPTTFGGGMNAEFASDGSRVYSSVPHCFEAGTPNIAGVIGFGKVIEYLNEIGFSNIEEHEKKLRAYLISKLKGNSNIVIYNEFSEGGIVAFNYKDIFAQDLSIYLNKYGICVRAGNHCAKILKDEINIKNTCRISLYFYNDEFDIDLLIEALSNPNIKNDII